MSAQPRGLARVQPRPGTDWWGLRGKRVVVAGAGGLGRASLEALVNLGARCSCVDVDAAALADVQAAMPSVVTRKADLTDPDETERVVDDLARELGGLDVAVHAVGVNLRKPVLDVAVDEWDRLMSVNLRSAFHFGQAVGRIMTARGYGRVIMFSSVAGLMAHQAHGPYAATKGGLNQLARVMAHEWATSGVTVNAIAPGYTPTALTNEHLAKPGVLDGLTKLVPMGRLGGADDVQGVVALLASERSSYVTGQVIYVDGGRTLV